MYVKVNLVIKKINMNYDKLKMIKILKNLF